MQDQQQAAFRIVPRNELSVEQKEKVEAALDILADLAEVEHYDNAQKDKSVDLSSSSKKRKKLEIRNFASKCTKCRRTSSATPKTAAQSSSDSEDSDSDSEARAARKKQKRSNKMVAVAESKEDHWCRSKILLTRTMMESLVDPITKAYRITTKDVTCPRQLRMFAKTARQSHECRDFFQNQVIKVLTPQQKVLELPLNGRHSLRYFGAMEDRGRALVKAVLSLDFDWDITVTFMKDCGFGSKSARKIIDEFYPPDKAYHFVMVIKIAEMFNSWVEVMAKRYVLARETRYPPTAVLTAFH